MPEPEVRTSARIPATTRRRTAPTGRRMSRATAQRMARTPPPRHPPLTGRSSGTSLPARWPTTREKYCRNGSSSFGTPAEITLAMKKRRASPSWALRTSATLASGTHPARSSPTRYSFSARPAWGSGRLRESSRQSSVLPQMGASTTMRCFWTVTSFAWNTKATRRFWPRGRSRSALSRRPSGCCAPSWRSSNRSSSRGLLTSSAGTTSSFRTHATTSPSASRTSTS
mmetsp:Transcript_27866/g.83283  ORF Transcript_27866/g.83283 Transcript_27866/m.83283 type:complete len:227 (+) Transcript_27866:137-817(+)